MCMTTKSTLQDRGATHGKVTLQAVFYILVDKNGGNITYFNGYKGFFQFGLLNVWGGWEVVCQDCSHCKCCQNGPMYALFLYTACYTKFPTPYD